MRSQQSRVILPRAFLMCWMLSRWRDCEKKSRLLSSSVLVWLTDSWLTQRQKQMSGLIQYDSWFPIVEEISDLYRFLEFPRHRVFLHRLPPLFHLPANSLPYQTVLPWTLPSLPHHILLLYHTITRSDLIHSHSRHLPHKSPVSPSFPTAFILSQQDTMLPSSTMPAQTTDDGRRQRLQ